MRRKCLLKSKVHRKQLNTGLPGALELIQRRFCTLYPTILKI